MENLSSGSNPQFVFQAAGILIQSRGRKTINPKQKEN